MADARSEDILNALDAAYEDGFDIANMSLGGDAHGIQDLLTIAVDNLDQANMVVAVASGNSGVSGRNRQRQHLLDGRIAGIRRART